MTIGYGRYRHGQVPYPHTVAVVGLGYIGLPTAVVLASRGVRVLGVDTKPDVVELIGAGLLHFYEPGLAAALSGVVAQGRLTATTEVPEVGVYIIAVPTPIDGGNQVDLTAVDAAVESIAPRLTPDALLILESTSPPGTTEAISRRIGELRPDLKMPHEGDGVPDVYLAHCPETVLPGKILTELVNNDRVIGGLTRRCAEKAAELYSVFCEGTIHLIDDAATAEMVKLVENAYRDVNIAFANELSMACAAIGLDVWQVIRLANSHPRVNVLSPGPGVGGHCIAVDPWFIVGAVPDHTPLIRTAREVNNRKSRYVAEEIVKIAQRFKEPVVTCLGLAYKPNVDDLRESPAIKVVADVAAALPDVRILACDPMISQLPSQLRQYPNVRFAESAHRAIAESDVVSLLVDHDLYHDFTSHQLSGKALFDTRGIWMSPAERDTVHRPARPGLSDGDGVTRPGTLPAAALG